MGSVVISRKLQEGNLRQFIQVDLPFFQKSLKAGFGFVMAFLVT